MKRAGASAAVIALTGAALLAACTESAPEPSMDGSGGFPDAGAAGASIAAAAGQSSSAGGERPMNGGAGEGGA